VILGKRVMQKESKNCVQGTFMKEMGRKVCWLVYFCHIFAHSHVLEIIAMVSMAQLTPAAC